MGRQSISGAKSKSAMRRLLLVPSFGLAMAAWSSSSLAQQVINGATPTPLSPTGVTGGVAMTGQGGGGTLNVGTVGGPEMDIYTNNSSGGAVTNPLLQAVSTDASSLSNIVFNSSSNVYGAIGITNPGGPFFNNISGGADGTAVNFMGGVYGTITTVTGAGSLNFQSGATNITATNFAGDGVISLGPNTTLIGAVTNSAANTGALSLGSGSVLTGAVGGATGLKAINVVGGSNSAGVSASISGAVNAYSFNLGTNTLNIGGALTVANNTASGVINTTLASPTVYGNIRPVGATNLGPALLVDVTVPSTAFIPVGTQFNIIQTQTGTVQSGTNGSVVTVTVLNPTNPLYTFSAVPVAGTVNGLVAITTTGIPLLAPVAPPPGAPPVVITPPGLPPIVVPPTTAPLPPVAPIAAPVVPAILSAGATASPTSDLVTNVLPAINALTTPAAVVLAVAQLAPSNSDLSAPLVTFQGSRAFQDMLSSRLDQSLCDQLGQTDGRHRTDQGSICPENSPHSGWWVKGFGYFGDQSAEGAFPGYDSKIFGGMLGFDTPVADDTRLGVGAGYERSTIDGKQFVNDTDFNTYQAMVYLAHDTGTWYLDADAAYSWNSYSAMRQILFPGIDRTALANYDGRDLTGLVTTGYHLFSQGLVVTPLASLQASRIGLDAYTETGAGDIDLNVNSQHYTFLESGLGIKVARPFSTGDGAYALPEIHFKWLHELDNPTLENVAAFTVAGSPSFTTLGLRSAADTFDVGAAFSLFSCGCSSRRWSVDAVYDYYWRNDKYSAQQVMLKVAGRF